MGCLEWSGVAVSLLVLYWFWPERERCPSCRRKRRVQGTGEYKNLGPGHQIHEVECCTCGHGFWVPSR